MNLNNYLFYFIKDKEIICKKTLGKRHADCIEDVSLQENLIVTDHRIETMIHQMLEKGYVSLMIFGGIYLFLPESLNEIQVDFLNNLDKQDIMKVKGYSKDKLPYGEFIDYNIENQIHGREEQTVEEIINKQIKIKNRSK